MNEKLRNLLDTIDKPVGPLTQLTKEVRIAAVAIAARDDIERAGLALERLEYVKNQLEDVRNTLEQLIE